MTQLIKHTTPKTVALPDKTQRQLFDANIDDNLFTEYVLSLVKRGKKRQTIEVYANNLMQYFKFLRMVGLFADEATEDTVYAFARLIQGKRQHTQKNYIGSVKRFYLWYANKYQASNPALEIEQPKIVDKYTKDIVLPQAIRKIMEMLYLKMKSTKNRKRIVIFRDAALLQVMIKTGLREVSVINLKVKDYDYEGGVPVLNYLNKGGTKEKAYPSPTCEKYLKKYLELRGVSMPDEPLFPSYSNRNKGEMLTGQSVWEIVRGLLLESGAIPAHKIEEYKFKVTPHSLRHTFGTYMYLYKGQDETQGEMGHQSGDVTRGYAKLAVQLKRSEMDRSFLDEIFD